MFIVADRVQETTNSPGTGTATLLGAVSGYQSFSTGIGANNTTFYVIADQIGTNWEVGLGALNSTGTVLTRTTVYSSSNGGSTVNFDTGLQYVWCDFPASRSVFQGTPVNFSSIGATTAGTGAFTTLSASSTVSGAGFSNYFAAPPTIGNTTPNTGNFTTLSADSLNLTNGIAATKVIYNEGGTGAVDTTVAAKLQETISVKDFGAVGDGVTDDSLAIQNALNACLSYANSCLYFPSGTYLLNTAVTGTLRLNVFTNLANKTVAQYLTIRGDGPQESVILGNNTTGALLLYFTTIYSNPSLTGNLADNTGTYDVKTVDSLSSVYVENIGISPNKDGAGTGFCYQYKQQAGCYAYGLWNNKAYATITLQMNNVSMGYPRNNTTANQYYSWNTAINAIATNWPTFNQVIYQQGPLSTTIMDSVIDVSNTYGPMFDWISLSTNANKATYGIKDDSDVVSEGFWCTNSKIAGPNIALYTTRKVNSRGNTFIVDNVSFNAYACNISVTGVHKGIIKNSVFYVLNLGGNNQNFSDIELQSITESFTATACSISGTTLTVGGTITGVVKPGQIITGTGIAANTTITAIQNAPTGGAGTYTVSVSQTIATEAMSGTGTQAIETFQILNNSYGMSDLYWYNRYHINLLDDNAISGVYIDEPVFNARSQVPPVYIGNQTKNVTVKVLNPGFDYSYNGYTSYPMYDSGNPGYSTWKNIPYVINNLTTYVTSAVISGVGSGYIVNDVITLVGGTYTTQATYTVTSVNGTGGVTGLSVNNAGSYTDPYLVGPQSTTGGTGTDLFIVPEFYAAYNVVVQNSKEILYTDVPQYNYGFNGNLKSWTPVLSFGGGSTGITYSTQVATYSISENVFTYNIQITLTSKGSSTGISAISLPSILNTNQYTLNQRLAINQGYGVFTEYTNMSGISAPVARNTGSTSLDLVSNGATTSAAITDTNFTNTSSFIISGSILLLNNIGLGI